MELKKVRFEAFKSMYDVSCELDRQTVITGPNGAGKSNFIDGFNFIGEVYIHGLEFAVARAGGYENLAHRRSRRATKPIAIHVEAEMSAMDVRRLLELNGRPSSARRKSRLPKGTILKYRHSFSFKTAGQRVLSDFKVESDELTISDQKDGVLFRLYREDGQIRHWITDAEGEVAQTIQQILTPYKDASLVESLVYSSLSPTELIIEQGRYARIFFNVRSALSRIRVFQLSPHQVRGSGVSTPNATLERHGENLPGAADHIRRNDPKAWDKIEQAMRAILPGLEEIDIAYTEDRRLALQFRERAVRRPWNSNEVSDGTIQALALFVALFDRRSPLLAIEEPENSVHPWILRQFLDLCGELRGKQILMTTHSPILLNYVDPKVIRLMSIQKGRSRVQRFLELDADIAGLTLSGEITLFEAYDSGAIPETVPQGFAPSEEDDGQPV